MHIYLFFSGMAHVYQDDTGASGSLLSSGQPLFWQQGVDRIRSPSPTVSHFLFLCEASAPMAASCLTQDVMEGSVQLGTYCMSEAPSGWRGVRELHEWVDVFRSTPVTTPALSPERKPVQVNFSVQQCLSAHPLTLLFQSFK
jgi:hypothetical protein